MSDKRIVLLTLLVSLWPAFAAGDVLVSSKGERIETAGPWEVKGRVVIFTTAGGVLSSVRLSEIDLEASEQATRALEAETAEEESAPPAEPVWVLTNDDIPRAAAAPAGRSLAAERSPDSEEGDEEAAEGEEPAAAEDPCAPNLTLGRPRVSDRSIVVNGTALPQSGCPKIGRIHWDWGDGFQANSFFPAEHTYAAPGQYRVVVEAFDVKGHKTRQQAVVTIR